MANSSQRQKPESASGKNVYAEVVDFSKQLVSERLVDMIENAYDFDGWDLSQKQADQLVKLLQHKQRIICSTFAFQLKNGFAELESAGSNDSDQKRELPESIDSAEADEIESIAKRCKKTYGDSDRNIMKRLQACLKRPRASIYENPLQTRRLCESFHHAIDGLKLKSSGRLALYRLFDARFIALLGPLYRQVDNFLLERGMLPELAPARIQLRSIEGLSESDPPQGLQLDQTACQLVILQRYKEKARLSESSFKNYFPELKREFADCGLTRHDEQIDQLNLIFKLIFEDEDLPLPVKQQLARLQIYVFITAIQEDGFLRRSSNPARRLLDGIIASEVEIARRGTAGFSGVRYIREHLDGLAKRQFITVDSYTEMLEGYQAYIEKNDLEQRRKKKQEAMRKVLPQVKERLSDITQSLRVLEISPILFEKIWLPLMVQIAIKHGMESDSWHKTVTMVQKQVWSLIPKENPEEQAELLEALPVIAHSVHRAMRSLKLAEPLQQSLSEYLKLEQQNVVEQTARNVIRNKRKTRSLSAQSFDNSDDNTEFDVMMETGMFQLSPDMVDTIKTGKPEKSKQVDQVASLSVGEWVNFHEGKNKTLGKLAWKADDASVFIFVDRDGKRICEVNAEELSKKFESGEVSLSGSDTRDSEKSRFSFMKSL